MSKNQITSAYIHIPFCNNICSYCDFPKLIKNNVWIDKYLDALEKEIKNNYKDEYLKTLYIGGGTPSSLDIPSLEKLFKILSIFNLEEDCEITFECNVDDLTEDKLKFLKNKVNRLSIGVQTFNNKYLSFLGRDKVDINKIKNVQKYFNNINIDLMYGFKDQTLEELKQDIDILLKLNIPHISTYCLILEENTKLYIEGYNYIEQDDTKDLFIKNTLEENNYIHYEISNYSKKGYESKHNLVYWNNQNYYGFGLGASGYIGNIRYDNTRSLTNYLSNQSKITHTLTKQEEIENHFILGLRKIKGINKEEFKSRYKVNIHTIYPVDDLLKNNLLNENNNSIYINPKYIYVSNEILLKFLKEEL